MRENEFEKKMLEKMEELQLRPSASVWPKVERQLVQKKRRRVAYFFFLLGGLVLLGYAGYTFLESEKSPVSKQENRNSITTPVATSKNNTAAITDNKNTVNDKNENNPAVAPATKTPGNGGISVTNTSPLTDNTPDKTGTVINKESSESIEKKLHAKKSVTTAIPGSDQKQAHKRNLKDQEQGQVDYHTAKPGVAKKKQQANIPSEADQPVGNPSLPAEEKKSDELAVKEPLQRDLVPVMVADSTQDKKESIVAISDTVATAPDKPVLAKNEKKRSRIKWGLDVSAGKNFSSEKVFSVLDPNKSLLQDALSASPSGGGGPVAPPLLPPSGIQAKAAFKVGVVAEKKLGRRSSINAGLRYAYLSEQIKTGALENRAVISNSYQYNSIQNGVYRSVQEKTYTNKYHFIELPILYGLQLNKSSKTGILWNAGVSFNYLVATNALVYDTASRGVYYKRSSAFNKLHFNFRTGLEIRFGNEGKLQWSIGPELSMSTTPLLKEDAITKKRYLMYGGLTTRFMLPR
jgi:hypothetical protein